MNRLHDALLLDGALKVQQFESSLTDDWLIEECDDHEVFAPLHYEPNYAYPLLVWLHEAGHDERQLRQVMPFVSMRNYVAVAPRATQVGDAAHANRGRGPFTWSQAPEQIQRAQDRIFSAIDHAHMRFKIHPNRIFLVGAGAGGTMAFRLAMNHPERFRAVLSLGGPFPTGHAPLGRLQEARRVPLFLASSRSSLAYPQPQVCRDLRLFHSAGMAVTLKDYPGAEPISDLILADVDRWIMEVIASEYETSVVAT